MRDIDPTINPIIDPTGTSLWTTAATGVLAAAGVAALLVGLANGPATANPTPAYGPGPVTTVHPKDDHRTVTGRPCFAVRLRWNIALDGPQPRC
jgi:hypothetical protein